MGDKSQTALLSFLERMKTRDRKYQFFLESLSKAVRAVARAIYKSQVRTEKRWVLPA